jgi:hypothetical protein
MHVARESRAKQECERRRAVGTMIDLDLASTMSSGTRTEAAAHRALNRPRDVAPGSLAGGVLLTIHRLSQGGADRVAMLLANGFAAANIPTGIAVLRGGGEGEDALLDLLRDDVP